MLLNEECSDEGFGWEWGGVFGEVCVATSRASLCVLNRDSLVWAWWMRASGTALSCVCVSTTDMFGVAELLRRNAVGMRG
jgi:hypothetical protein